MEEGLNELIHNNDSVEENNVKQEISIDKTKEFVPLRIIIMTLIMWTIIELSASHINKFGLMYYSNVLFDFYSTLIILCLCFFAWGLNILLFDNDPESGFIAVLLV